MRKILGLLWMVGGLMISCLPKGQGSAEDPGKGLEVHWQLESNRYQGGSGYLSRFTIFNKGREPLGNNWELFFSFAACRSVDLSSVPSELKLEHLGGDLYRLTPLRGFKDLDPDNDFSFTLITSDWAIKPGDGPSGFYFVFDQRDDQLVFPEYSIGGFEGDALLKRHEQDLEKVPSAEVLFNHYQDLKDLHEDEMAPWLPAPVFWEFTPDQFCIPETLTIGYQNGLENEAAFLQRQLQEQHGISAGLMLNKGLDDQHIILEMQPLDHAAASEEAYEMRITGKGVRITGASASGVFYGIQSLRAILPLNTETTASCFPLKGLFVQDYPSMKYRGMHLDVARNFQPLKEVLKLLDIMSFYKLNTFHFHLTDDEGWRLEIASLPELTGIGSRRIHTRDESEGLIHQYGSAGSGAGTGYYTREEYIEILRYAAERHIEVIPEIDMPGHARAAIVSMKERSRRLKEAGDEAGAAYYSLHEPDDQSKYLSVQKFNDNVIPACQESTYHFLEAVVDELQAMHKDAGVPLKVVHTGGDEVPKGAWSLSKACIDLFGGEEKITHKAMQYYLQRFYEILNVRNIRMAGWEEIGLDGENAPDGRRMPDQADWKQGQRLYVWNSIYGVHPEELPYRLANAGYEVVLSNVTHLYFDMAANKDPREPGFYWGGFSDLEKTFFFLPYDLVDPGESAESGNGKLLSLSEEGKRNLIGIQGQLWAETIISPERLEYMVFPRLLALAERAWSPQPEWSTGQMEAKRALNEFLNRVGKREFSRLDHWFGGVRYRLNPPGAKIEKGILYVRPGMPGVYTRYTTDGSEPSLNSPVYRGPVRVKGRVRVRNFNAGGRESLSYPLESDLSM